MLFCLQNGGRRQYVQEKTKGADAGGTGSSPYQGLLRYDPARHGQIPVRPLYRRRQLSVRVGDPGISAVHRGTGDPVPACGPEWRDHPHLPPAGGSDGTAEDYPKRHPPEPAEKRRERRNHRGGGQPAGRDRAVSESPQE